MINIKKKISLTNLLVVLSIILYLFIFLLFFQYTSVDVNNNIDGSWQYTISSFRSSQQSIGRDIFYTYGPLFQRIPTYPVQDDNILTFFSGIILFSTVAFGQLYILFRLLKNTSLPKDNKLVIPFFTAVTLLYCLATIPGVDALYYFSLLLAIITVRTEKNIFRKMIFVFIISLFSFYKVSFSVALLGLLPIAFIDKPSIKNPKNTLLEFGGSILIFITTFSMVGWVNPFTIFQYMKYGVLNASAYTEFMGLPFAENQVLVVIYSLIIVISLAITGSALLFYRAKSNNKMMYLASYIVLFFVYKQSIVRSDDHLLTFVPFLPLLFLLPIFSYGPLIEKLPYIKKSLKQTYILIITVVYLCCILLYPYIIREIYPAVSNRKVFYNKKIHSISKAITNNPLNYFAFTDAKRITTQALMARSIETKGVNNYLERKNLNKTDIFYLGNTTSLGGTLSGLQISYLPFVQNYAAFPPKTFDKLYMETLQKQPSNPIIIDEKEPSINERIPSHELNNTFQYIINNYTASYVDQVNKIYLFEPNSRRNEVCSEILTLNTTKGSTVDIPDRYVDSGEYIKLKVDFEKNYTEQALGIIFKKPLYSLSFYSGATEIGTFRTTQSTLDHGISIMPLYLSYTDKINNTPLMAEKVMIFGGLTKGASVSVHFELCRFQE